MRTPRSAVFLVAAVGVASAGAATTPTAGRPLLTYVVAPLTRGNAEQTIYRGLCATDLRGHTFRISDPHDNVEEAWSPDGRSIAFVRRDNNPGQDHNGDVFVTDAEGRHPRNLTRGAGRGTGSFVAWSSDGSQVILHWSNFWVETSYVWNVDDSGGHNLGLNQERVTGGSWSPQGRILFTVWQLLRTESGWSPNRIPAIYVADGDGTHRSKLIDSAAGAVWSPDGRQFAYRAFRNSNFAGLGVANADGSGAHVLIEGKVGLAGWSPDGRQLAYFGALDDAGVPRSLEVVQADGKGAHLVVQGPVWEAAWSPDGRLIAFTRGSTGLFLIRPDGTGEHAVPTGGLAARSPAWRRPAPLPADRRPCVVRGTERADVIRGTSRGDLILAGRGNDRIYGNGGDDALVGAGGRDRLDGADGEDALFGGSGHDRAYGGRGRDLFRMKDGHRDFLFGGPGDDGGWYDSVDLVRSLGFSG
jgi:hypothetical protein